VVQDLLLLVVVVQVDLELDFIKLHQQRERVVLMLLLVPVVLSLMAQLETTVEILDLQVYIQLVVAQDGHLLLSSLYLFGHLLIMEAPEVLVAEEC
jgi:hypothetical protein